MSPKYLDVKVNVNTLKSAQGVAVMLNSGDFENRSRSTIFNRVLALIKIDLNV